MILLQLDVCYTILIITRSTTDALTLFETGSSNFLPREFLYFDDIVGGDIWLSNDYIWQRLAIDEFNKKHELQKIYPNYYLMEEYRIPWFSSMIRI